MKLHGEILTPQQDTVLTATSKIYELREQAQLTQNELAAKASMSRAGLSQIPPLRALTERAG